MELTKLEKAIATKKNGSFFNILYTKDLPLNAPSKKAGVIGTKLTRVLVRKGIDYDSQKSVQDKVLNEGKVLTHELPWGHWKEGHENIIEHNGKNYVRLYLCGVPTTKYFVNGSEMNKEELHKTGVCVESFFKPNDEVPDAITVCVDNILEIL